MFKAIWFNRKLRSGCMQLMVLVTFFGLAAWLFDNARSNLAARGITAGYGFLQQSARFPISESMIAYSTDDSFGRAFLVGLSNTVFISFLVMTASTLLGLLLALARRSVNPLLRGAAGSYIEVVRNIPLVVQLLFWYGLATVNLPPAREALSPFPGVFLSLRGLFLPKPELDGATGMLWSAILAGVLLMTAAFLLTHTPRLRPRRNSMLRYGLGLSALLIILAWFEGGVTARWDMPALDGFNFVGGTAFTPEFLALLVGLVIYSAGFVGEVIRGGIEAIPRGQWEAGDALGLARGQTLRLVVFPQALRVIVPPMTSQYLSIIKNSTLALAVGYPDLSFVVATTINQTGQAVEGILILMSVFLAISLFISLLMNWYNRRLVRFHH